MSGQQETLSGLNSFTPSRPQDHPRLGYMLAQPEDAPHLGVHRSLLGRKPHFPSHSNLVSLLLICPLRIHQECGIAP